MNESEEKAKRKRKPNWSQDQLLLLVCAGEEGDNKREIWLWSDQQEEAGGMGRNHI